MLDFVLGLALAGLAVRGWFRGFIKEIFDLIGLVVGVWLAFRISPPLGDFLTHSFGVTPEIARIGAGILLFVLFGVSLAIGAHYLTKVMKLPGLNLANRIGGAGVALGWGVLLLLVLVNVVRVMPLGDSLEDTIEDSAVISAIAGPDAIPQRLFHRIAGDSVLVALQSIQNLFGTSRVVVVDDEVVTMPLTPFDEVRQVRSDADLVLDEINKFRVGEGVGALQVSARLVEMAERKALESYVNGRLLRTMDCVATATSDAGISLAVCTDLVALASSALGAFDGIVGDATGESVLSDSRFDRTGIGVADGPHGRLVVVILGG